MSNVEIILYTILIVIMAFTISFFYFSNIKRFKIKNVEPELERFLNQLWKANIDYSEKTGQKLEALEAQIINEKENSKKVKAALNQFVAHIIKEMDGLTDRVSTIQELTVEKENKIKRFEDGYDLKILNSFTAGIIRTISSIDNMKKADSCEIVEEVKEDLLLLLFNAGIEEVSIKEGLGFNDVSDIAQIMHTEETDDVNKNGTIKNIISNAYVIKLSDEQRKVVKLAQVVTYKMKGE